MRWSSEQGSDQTEWRSGAEIATLFLERRRGVNRLRCLAPYIFTCSGGLARLKLGKRRGAMHSAFDSKPGLFWNRLVWLLLEIFSFHFASYLQQFVLTMLQTLLNRADFLLDLRLIQISKRSPPSPFYFGVLTARGLHQHRQAGLSCSSCLECFEEGALLHSSHQHNPISASTFS